MKVNIHLSADFSKEELVKIGKLLYSMFHGRKEIANLVIDGKDSLHIEQAEEIIKEVFENE